MNGSRETLPPDIAAALYGPGWEKIPGTREFREAQLFYPSQPINPAGWEAFLAHAQMSTNIEDRRQPRSLWDLRRFLPFMGR